MPWPTYQKNTILSPSQLWNKYTLYYQTKPTIITIWWSGLYFGILRVSKFTALSSYHNNSFSDLLLSDIAIDNHVASQVTRITLKHSKTDQYRQGTHIYLGRNSYQVFLVKALICSLDRSRGRPGPLLYYLPISYSPEQYSVQHSTQKFTMHSHNFNTHSFRISAATSAKQAGISDSHNNNYKSFGQVKKQCLP